MMNVAERKQTTAPAEAQRWLESFEAALQAHDAAAAAELFLPTASGATCWPSPGPSRPCLAGRRSRRRCARRSRARQPRNFHIPAKRTPPRWVTRAGTEAIEALFEFETAFGRGAGVVRLMPRCQLALARLDDRHDAGRTEGTRRGVPGQARAPTARATSAPTTGATASPRRAPTPITIRLSLSSAAARRDFRSPRGCISSASTR